jgi:hypothetical protein
MKPASKCQCFMNGLLVISVRISSMRQPCRMHDYGGLQFQIVNVKISRSIAALLPALVAKRKIK